MLQHIIGLQEQIGLLRRVTIFAHLTHTELEQLARRIAIKRWSAGAIIVGEREEEQALYLVYQGRVKVCLFGENGREMTLATLGAGGFFGELSLIDGHPRSANVVAHDDAVLFVLDREAIDEHLRQHPATMQALLRSLAQRLRQSDNVIANLALHDVNARLTRTLIDIARSSGERHVDGLMIPHRPTQQDLANMVGTCRETVSRTLSSMARRGLVVSRGRTLLLRHELLDSVRKAA